MSQRLLIPALWVTSAAATFGLGWAVKPGTEPASKDSDSDHIRLTARGGQGNASSGSNYVASAAEIELGMGADLGEYIIGGEISAESMALAIADMRKENDPIKKRAMFSQLLTQLTPDNAKSALLALRERGGRDRRGFGGRGGGFGGGGDEERLLLNAWGRIDGEGAVAELKAMDEARRAEREAERLARGEDPEGPGQGRGGRGGDRGGFDRSGFDITSVLSGWATSDAAGAMGYVNEIEDERMRGMMSGNVIRGLMINGVDDAVAFIGSMPADDENRGRHMWSVAEEVLEDGAANAAQWVDGLADDLRGGAMSRIAESYAREDLDAAISWVGEHGSEDYARRAVTQVAERWAETDPQAVIDWASNLPEETQQSVFSEALDEWTERDEVAASQYLAQMEASPVRDSAVQGFANELSRSDPEAAATWAATIADEEIRAETVSRVARDWIRSDREAAEAWLPTSGLTEEQQQSVTSDRGRGFGNRGGGGGGRGR